MAEDSEAPAPFGFGPPPLLKRTPWPKRSQADELLQQTHDTIDSCTSTTLITLRVTYMRELQVLFPLLSLPSPLHLRRLAGTREPSICR